MRVGSYFLRGALGNNITARPASVGSQVYQVIHALEHVQVVFDDDHRIPLIHQPLGGAQGQASDILIAAKEIEKLRTELFGIIAEHSGQPLEKVMADGDRDFWMTAQEAKDYGMVDEILVRKKK